MNQVILSWTITTRRKNRSKSEVSHQSLWNGNFMNHKPFMGRMQQMNILLWIQMNCFLLRFYFFTDIFKKKQNLTRRILLTIWFITWISRGMSQRKLIAGLEISIASYWRVFVLDVRVKSNQRLALYLQKIIRRKLLVIFIVSTLVYHNRQWQNK